MIDPLAFVASVLALLALPGPTNTLLATAGGLVGTQRAVRLIPAELAGYSLAIGLITALVHPLLASHPELTKHLRLVGSAVLVVLALRLWWQSGSAETAAAPARISGLQVFLTTLFNPKALVFSLGVIPHLAEGEWLQAAPYLATFAALIIAVASSWAALGSALNRAGPKARFTARSIRRAAAVVLVFFACVISSSVFL